MLESVVATYKVPWESDELLAHHKHPSSVILIVADPDNETAGGDVAVNVVEACVHRYIYEVGTVPNEYDLAKWLADMDNAVEKRPSAGQTSTILVRVDPINIMGASVGTSQAWIVDDNGYTILTDRQNRFPILGSAAAVPVAFFSPFGKGTLLMASRSLFEHAAIQDIQTAVLHPSLLYASNTLADLIRRRDGSMIENLHVVLCRRTIGDDVKLDKGPKGPSELRASDPFPEIKKPLISVMEEK